MTTNTRNPVWANAEQTLIDCEINHPQYGWIPFTASPDDTEQHGRELFAFLSQGTIGAYIAPPALPAQTYAEKRRAEYPPIGDQLDALWKGGDAATEMLAAVQEVKAKYPKE
jgi:hypothetical protein